MTKSKDSRNFWSIIGKTALVLTIVWILIQMFNNFIKEPDYKLDANGNYARFQIPNDYNKVINEYVNILAIDSAIVENKDKNTFESISYLKEISNNESILKEIGIDYKIPYYSSVFRERLNIPVYKSYWWFSVTNTGSKPLEDLVLELPFNGYYSLNMTDKANYSSKYSQRIKIGELKPSYSAQIKVWSKDDVSLYPEFDEEKTRFTHKFGWDKIDYPKEVNGILAWNIKNDNFPLLIFSFLLIILLFVAFGLGIDYAPKYVEKEKKRKLKELEELEKLKKEDKESQNNEKKEKNNNG